MGVLIGIVVFLLLVSAFGYWLDAKLKKKAKKKEEDRLKSIAEKKFLFLKDKYDIQIAVKLINGEYWIGMTKDQVLDAKGRKPDNIEKEHLKTRTKEIWYYGQYKSSSDVFVFVDGITEKITDRPDNDHPVKVSLT